MCCSRFSRSLLTRYCVPPLLPPSGHRSGILFCLFGVTLATTTDGGGQFKNNNNRRWWPVEELFVHTTQVFFQQSAQTCGIRKKKMERLPLCPAATRPRIVARCRCRETSLRNGNHHRQTQPQWNKEKESVDRTGKKKCGLQVLLPCLCAPYTFTCPCVCCVCCILLPLQVKKKKN